MAGPDCVNYGLRAPKRERTGSWRVMTSKRAGRPSILTWLARSRAGATSSGRPTRSPWAPSRVPCID